MFTPNDLINQYSWYWCWTETKTQKDTYLMITSTGQL